MINIEFVLISFFSGKKVIPLLAHIKLFAKDKLIVNRSNTVVINFFITIVLMKESIIIPKVSLYNIDYFALNLICATTIKFQVYNASAGSGKTFTLVKEYLKVLEF